MKTLPLYGKLGAGRSAESVVAAHAALDDEDYEWAAGYRWNLSDKGYAVRSVHLGRQSLHREILGLARHDPREGDHIDRDRLNNRRANLRVVTRAQGGQNIQRTGGSSAFRGVSWDAAQRAWLATVVSGGRQVLRSHHLDELEAARAAWAKRRECMTHATTDTEPDVSSCSPQRFAPSVRVPRRNRKLTDAQVAEGKRRVADGEMQKDIAADFGISPGKMSQILSGKRYGPSTRPLAK